MKVEEIEIFAGKPDFGFTPIRRLEVKCEASNALMPAPTIEEANGRLRALAAKVGANAITEVEYNSGVSFTSWKSLKASGLAGIKLSDDATCDVCAETIKRAATKCRYCGTDRTPMAAEPMVPAQTGIGHVHQDAQEPLRDNNNPAIIIGLCVFALFIFMMIIGSA
ncbi:MAG: hypothetical protein QHC67_03585 [Sphingobium sp.]|uniref:hypothetical protein n=1 Tax=Sphingobium sp. TaxID=1912891 RepID=UPI0029BE9EB5|nr:hypothetical protein [Sphingobium sp.]MDX3908881.1 hypothetical protein [Sphingobium sp.]